MEQDYRSRYYESQSILRGIKNVEDVKRIEEYQSSIYDKILFKYISKYKNKTVVEIACGPGFFLRYLKNKGFVNTLGIDLDDKYLDLCEKQNLDVIKKDAIQWLQNKEPKSVDLFIAIDFLEHLEKDSLVNFLDEIRKTIKEDGSFISRLPSGDSPFFGLNYHNDITHQTILSTTALTAVFKMCGFEIVSMIDECPTNFYKSKYVYLKSKIIRYLTKKVFYYCTSQVISCLSPTMWLICKPLKDKI